MGPSPVFAAVALIFASPEAERPPSDAPLPSALPPSAPGQRALMFIDAGAREARRQRRVRSAFDLSFGAVQAAVGLYGVIGLWDRGPGVRRQAIGEVATGGSSLVIGGVFLGLPSQMERLRLDPEYGQLRADPGAHRPLAALERRWRRRAAWARTLRQISGSITVVAGVGLAAWGAVSLALGDPDRSDGASVWALVTTTGGAALVVRGGLDLALRSPAEEAWDAYVNEDPPAPPARVTFAPGLAGASVSGRF